MKWFITFLGIILIIAGIAIFAYPNFSYTKHENLAQVGDFKVTADTKNTVYFPPISGGVSIAVGIVLVVIGVFRFRR